MSPVTVTAAHAICYVTRKIIVIFTYRYFETDECTDPCMQQNKPQSSLTSNISTEFSKTRNAVYVCLTQLCKWKINAIHYKEMLIVLIAKIVANLASYLSHIHYTPHEQEQWI
jgi:hypothetical protein